MMLPYKSLLFTLLVAAWALPAQAQQAIGVVAVPQFATPKNEPTSAGDSGVIARQVSDVITSDLRSIGDLMLLGPDRLRVYSYPEATAPSFSQWRGSGAKTLVTGFVQALPDGRLTIACYLHDIGGGRELARQGFRVAPAEWRRAAHRCADTVYAKLTGRSGGFDSRIAYVAESGAGPARVTRLALMDSDGSSHRYLTAGDATVLTPRLSPSGDRVAYVSFSGGRPHVRTLALAGNEDRAAMPDAEMSFAPRFSPDGRRLVLTVAAGGNSDIYSVEIDSGAVQRLTVSPGTDTSPSFSPDGSRIVFESDRSGTPQLYVMNADGSAQRRISFGGGRYGSPSWSPDGERIAFVRVGGDGLRVGTMSRSGGAERILTDGPFDEGPSWGASGRNLMFQRGVGSRTAIHVVSVDGGAPRAIVTPQGGSDPDWSAAGGAK